MCNALLSLLVIQNYLLRTFSVLFRLTMIFNDKWIWIFGTLQIAVICLILWMIKRHCCSNCNVHHEVMDNDVNDFTCSDDSKGANELPKLLRSLKKAALAQSHSYKMLFRKVKLASFKEEQRPWPLLKTNSLFSNIILDGKEPYALAM